MNAVTVDVITSRQLDLPNGGSFSPTTAALLLGPTEAVLVDTQYRDDDIDEVIDRIEKSGRTLTSVIITHAHPDHYFGLERILTRFPEASAIATRAVADAASEGIDDDRAHAREFFGGAAVDNATVPAAEPDGGVRIDGESVELIDVPQADIHPAAIVHVPASEIVVAGDAVYNKIHPFLAASGPAEWPKWIETLDIVAELRPSTVVAGHKQPGLPDSPEAIAETRAYLSDFIDGVEEAADSRALVARIQDKYPDFGNRSALVLSAVTAFRMKKS